MSKFEGNQWSISLRPKTLGEVCGQEHITTYFRNIKESGKNYPTSIWFNGRFGCGKTTLAKIIAKTIQCKNPKPNGDPCNECISCQDIDNETFARDTIMFNAGTDGVIDAVRELLSGLETPSMFGRQKVVVVEEAQQLEAKATQAFLKFVEKPRNDVFFIFTSMEEDPVKMDKFKALISRSKRFDVKIPSISDLMMYLKGIMEHENLWTDDTIPKWFKFNGLKSIASNSQYSYREAIQNLEKCIDAKAFTEEEMADQFGLVSQDTVYAVLLDILNGKGTEEVQRAFFTGTVKSRESYFNDSYNVVVGARTLKAFSGQDANISNLVRTIGYFIGGFDEGDVNKLKVIASHKNLEILAKGFHDIKNSPLGFKDWFNAADVLCSIIIDCKNTQISSSSLPRAVNTVSNPNLTHMTTDTVVSVKPEVSQSLDNTTPLSTSPGSNRTVASAPSGRTVVTPPTATPTASGRVIRRG